MLKTGIAKLDTARDPAAQRGFFGGTRKISITLYPDACRDADDEGTAERILSQFMDSRKVYKRTYAHRFPDFDKAVAGIIRDNINGDALKIHDMAVSDGRTAVDFFTVLSPLFSGVSYTASDFNPVLSTVRRGGMTLSFSEDGQILEICRPPFVFNRAKDSALYYPINAFFRFWLEKAAARYAQAYRRGEMQGDDLLVFSPGALKLAQDDARFTLCKYDMLNPLPERHDVIRAMNVLDPGYFTHDELRCAVAHLHDGVLEGGLLVIGSNENPGSPVQGGVYRRTEGGFEEIWRAGKGATAHAYLTDRA